MAHRLAPSALLAFMLAAACTRTAAPAPSLSGNLQVEADLARLRTATRSFASLDSAVAADGRAT